MVVTTEAQYVQYEKY